MSRVLILGYGNPLRSDDGFGCHAAEQLSASLQSADVEVLARRQLTPELAEVASHFQLVIFIDAACDSAPGKVQCCRIVNHATREQFAAFSHSFTPASLVAWTARLYDHCPEAYSISVGGQSFAEGDSISSIIKDALTPVTAQVRALIAGCE